MKLNDTTAAVQGFGNVGSFSAKLLYDQKAKIVALSDVNGAIYNEKGLNPYEVEKFVQQTGSVAGYPDAGELDNKALLELPVTVLIPAALEGQITVANADRIKARIIAEGANGPTTPEADAILFKKVRWLFPIFLPMPEE